MADWALLWNDSMLYSKIWTSRLSLIKQTTVSEPKNLNHNNNVTASTIVCWKQLHFLFCFGLIKFKTINTFFISVEWTTFGISFERMWILFWHQSKLFWHQSKECEFYFDISQNNSFWHQLRSISAKNHKKATSCCQRHFCAAQFCSYSCLSGQCGHWHLMSFYKIGPTGLELESLIKKRVYDWNVVVCVRERKV